MSDIPTTPIVSSMFMDHLATSLLNIFFQLTSFFFLLKFTIKRKAICLAKLRTTLKYKHIENKAELRLLPPESSIPSACSLLKGEMNKYWGLLRSCQPVIQNSFIRNVESSFGKNFGNCLMFIVTKVETI